MKHNIELIVLSPFIVLGFLLHAVVTGFQAGRMLYVMVIR